MNIGVFFGSRSPEHDISIITGQLVISGLKKLGHNVVPVYLDKQGQWLIASELGEMKAFTGNNIDLNKYKNYYLDLEESRGKLVFKKKGLAGKTVVVDLAFPAFHGSNGEDGTIQGLFEIFNVPYVGCNVPASAIAMNKTLTKLLCQACGIPTAEFKTYGKAEWDLGRANILDDLEKSLGYPMIVKPPLLGSSIGIAKAADRKSLEQAIDTAFYYGNDVLVEDYVENLVDITCAVLGNADDPLPSMLQESVVSTDLLSYEDKYMNDGGTQTGKSAKNLIIPARLSTELTKQIQETALKAFKALGCTGIARVDFLYDQKSSRYFLTEVNTLPGTLYHHLWAKSGIELGELLYKLIHYAQDYHQHKSRYATVFQSDILKLAGSIKLQTKTDEHSISV